MQFPKLILTAFGSFFPGFAMVPNFAPFDLGTQLDCCDELHGKYMSHVDALQTCDNFDYYFKASSEYAIFRKRVFLKVEKKGRNFDSGVRFFGISEVDFLP